MDACRARLYRIASKEMDTETPPVTAEWKESCKRAIIPKVYVYMYLLRGAHTAVILRDYNYYIYSNINANAYISPNCCITVYLIFSTIIFYIQ